MGTPDRYNDEICRSLQCENLAEKRYDGATPKGGVRHERYE